MKVAINRQYGGFGLSLKAIKMFLDLKGLECHLYKIPTYFKGCYKIDDETYNKELFAIVSTKDFGKCVDTIPNEDCFDTEMDRADKDLIKVIEELGEEANGKYSFLKIVEIPDGIEWEIDDYDGMETVEEKHRSWY